MKINGEGFLKSLLMEIIIEQDSVKTISNRQSTQILDFLGDIGGFHGALMLIFLFFGEFFSSRLFNSSIS